MQISDIQNKLKEYFNVLKMARKPDWEEFSMTAKVALAVMFVVGFIGFAIYILMEILPGALK
ncbi:MULTISPECIES: protein translocase SEC61 complex subunit gamma [unclassified Archaeoglobus]|jgi:protein transport protein SEC61 subunit gamma-like protein|uniref:protein translocase SEC61 complex subunit gamma n=1 Tax=unclassified Archaeoglobus TaxID=2643606 RepID=UPI0025BEF764|nr:MULTISPECIES: protein translocase SEC61 complex subunit gamma [unclassified Archaeoglobus]